MAYYIISEADLKFLVGILIRLPVEIIPKNNIFLSRCVVARDDISKGDEIFVKYNYPIGNPSAQPWYRELYEVEVGPWPSDDK